MKQQDSTGAELASALPANWERFGMAGKKRDETGENAPNKRSGHVALAFDPIAAALRQMHDEVASEDIPDDFLKLLDEIDDRVKQRKDAK